MRIVDEVVVELLVADLDSGDICICRIKPFGVTRNLGNGNVSFVELSVGCIYGTD